MEGDAGLEAASTEWGQRSEIMLSSSKPKSKFGKERLDVNLAGPESFSGESPPRRDVWKVCKDLKDCPWRAHGAKIHRQS